MYGAQDFIRLQLSRLMRDERGASALEYTLLLVMVALILVTFVPGVQTQISAAWTAITSAITPLPGS